MYVDAGFVNSPEKAEDPEDFAMNYGVRIMGFQIPEPCSMVCTIVGFKVLPNDTQTQTSLASLTRIINRFVWRIDSIRLS